MTQVPAKTARPAEVPALWIQGAGCSGCSVSVLNGVAPDIAGALLDEMVPGKHLNLRFHPTIMAGSGEPALRVLAETSSEKAHGYVLVVEGAIPTASGGAFCVVGEEGERPVSFAEHVERLARGALFVVALGDCAAFGGIPSCSPNPTGCVGTSKFLASKGVSVPVVNVGGCPPNPDWFLGAVAHVLMRGLPAAGELDPWGRLKLFHGKLVHDNCQRRASFDTAHFARHPGEPGCLYLLGCKGPMTYADCPDRQWNGGTNWCVRAGAPCMGCAEPRFFERFGPVYEKVTDDRLSKLRGV